jgi:ribonuclease/clavin/mitogillin
LPTNIVNVGYDSTNYYVVEQGGVRLLVDVGWPGTLPKLVANLKRSDIVLQSIKYLLITHYHPDHAGLAQEIKAQGVRLIVVETQVSAIPGLQVYMKPSHPYVPITLQDNLRSSVEASRAFLLSIGFTAEIISTPGHSDDSVTLVLDSGAAFTGDLTAPALAFGAAGDAIRRSWEAIRALHVTRVYPGHGPTRLLSQVLEQGL